MKKRFLIPLLAALALPTAVSAETYSLMIHERKRFNHKASVFGVISNITFSSEQACREEGEKFIIKQDWLEYHCFKGD